MPDGGCLNIQTRYIQNLNENKNTGYQESKGNLEITVSDNGMGIPSEIKSKIFMPFFSSKKNSHSGVGLSIVQDIVQSLHGTITCKNNDDKGASFKITFPIYDSALHHYGIPA